jgi:hypothetical protein
MKHTHEHRKLKRRLTAGLLVSLVLVSGALAFASPLAMAEGGGTPIQDQGITREMKRNEAINNPGLQTLPQWTTEWNGGQNIHPDRRYDRDNRYSSRGRHYDRNHRYSGRSYRSYPRSYAYADPYYYDPHPTPGINLLFGF